MTRRPSALPLTSAVAVLVSGALLLAQTKVTPPKNSYSLAQDVQLGRDAAAQAREQLPIMKDDAVSSYVENVGKRLVAAIPPELQHKEFTYTFETVNVREINAFALPGGPMFVNRGMIEAAASEGEAAGVMAHEISHVVLRHGTAQATKANKYQFGQIAGAVLGAIIGGAVGDVVSQGTQFGVGAVFLRFSRDYEKQADLEGAQIMARAGYDPRDMANMFKTIEKEGGAGGPEWLNSHPNPGNRSDYITKEAETLHIVDANRDGQAFATIRAHLKSLPPAPTTEEATKNAKGSSSKPDAKPSERVEAPSSRFSSYAEGGLFRVSVPSNWKEMPSSNAVTFAPDGAVGQLNGQGVFTHGVEMGVANAASRDLQAATDAFVRSLAQSNPSLSRPSGYQRASMDGRSALSTTLSNESDATGQRETIQVATSILQDGRLFYAVAVAPDADVRTYAPVFQRVLSSIRFTK